MGMETSGILLYLFLGTIAQFANWEIAFAATGILSVLLASFFFLVRTQVAAVIQTIDS